VKIFRKKTVIALLSLFVVLTTGFIYEKINVTIDKKLYKPVGKLYPVDNKLMHIYSGGSGDYTIIFAAGWGTVNPYVDFYPLYNEVSKHAKFAVFDRFGYGYSDITGKERDIDAIVEELHELLLKSDQEPPYIFVAHSLASLETIRYAQTYRNEVKGIILIDGGNPEFYAAAKPVTFISILQRMLIKIGAARTLYELNGFSDFVNSERNQLRLLTPELRNLDKTSTLLKANNKNITDEMSKSQENAKIVVSGGNLGNIPLTVITSGDFGGANKEWLDSQQKLKEWSDKSKQFVVQDASHYIHHYRPEIINKEIAEMMNIDTDYKANQE
jgi:pimeloyl-ACP methyl ester carboxylesterase